MATKQTKAKLPQEQDDTVIEVSLRHVIILFCGISLATLVVGTTLIYVKDHSKIKLAWGLTLFWFIVGFGPFATIGNSIFSDPNSPLTWAPFGLPSLWVWQLVFLAYGIFVMWFLAFHMGMSEPIDMDKIEKIAEKIHS